MKNEIITKMQIPDTVEFSKSKKLVWVIFSELIKFATIRTNVVVASLVWFLCIFNSVFVGLNIDSKLNLIEQNTGLAVLLPILAVAIGVYVISEEYYRKTLS